MDRPILYRRSYTTLPVVAQYCSHSGMWIQYDWYSMPYTHHNFGVLVSRSPLLQPRTSKELILILVGNVVGVYFAW